MICDSNGGVIANYWHLTAENVVFMSGHNKWSTIKRKKGAADARRSKIFSKIIKEITVSVKEGGADPDGNARLRTAIANAKGASMPKDTLLRAINKGSDKDGINYNETTYEGYVNGIALFVEATTDNSQRTLSNVRALLNKYSGTLGVNGSLAHVFDRKGIFVIPAANIGTFSNEDLEMELIDGGAEDIAFDDDYITVTTAMEDFGNMMKKLETLNIETENAELQRIPITTMEVTIDAARKFMRVVDILDDDDDVTNVFHNMEMTDEIEEALEDSE